MQLYAENVDGSVVEERESALIWNHKNAEEEHGNQVVKELYNQIKYMLGNCPVDIVQGKGYIEVKPKKLKKVRKKLCRVILILEKIAEEVAYEDII